MVHCVVHICINSSSSSISRN